MDDLEERKKIRDFESADIEGVNIELEDEEKTVKKSFSEKMRELLKDFSK